MSASLPRRPILGIAVAGFSGDGVIVGAVAAHSMAAAAGVERGDVVTAIDGQRIRDAKTLRAVVARLDDHATIETTRGRATVVVHRRAELAGVDYLHVASRGARLRVLRRRRGPGSVLFLQGITLSSIEEAPAFDALLGAVDRTAIRLERRGVGDSEGDEPDFEQEVDDFRAALAIAEPPVTLVGHSIGGMIAPLLFGEPVDAIVVIGTSARPWLSCLDESARRQARLAGIDEETAVRAQRAEIEHDRDERSRAFHEQLDAVELRAAWSRVRCPVLSLHGEYDWVVSEEESRDIPGARFATIPSLDHAMTVHDSLESSRASFGRGLVDDRVGVAIAAFLRDDVPNGHPSTL